MSYDDNYYKQKYLKYKNKYLELKGGTTNDEKFDEINKDLKSISEYIPLTVTKILTDAKHYTAFDSRYTTNQFKSALQYLIDTIQYSINERVTLNSNSDPKSDPKYIIKKTKNPWRSSDNGIFSYLDRLNIDIKASGYKFRDMYMYSENKEEITDVLQKITMWKKEIIKKIESIQINIDSICKGKSNKMFDYIIFNLGNKYLKYNCLTFNIVTKIGDGPFPINEFEPFNYYMHGRLDNDNHEKYFFDGPEK
jgi:hypothetical protein